MFFDELDLYHAGDHGYHECRIPCLITSDKGTILAFNEAKKNTGRDSDLCIAPDGTICCLYERGARVA